MEKISLNTSPSSILSATIGDVFELDGGLVLLCREWTSLPDTA